MTKCINGLEQSAHCWNISQYFKSVAYHKSRNADGCIYVKPVKEANDHIKLA